VAYNSSEGVALLRSIVPLGNSNLAANDDDVEKEILENNLFLKAGPFMTFAIKLTRHYLYLWLTIIVILLS
jgi:hypothetical protein